MPCRCRPCGAVAAGFIGIVLGALAAGAVSAGDIVGRPRVVDGDTLDFAGQTVRLYGIDAPEAEQTCRAGTRTWPCGKEARWAAINRVSPHWVTCVERERSPDGGVAAVCYLAGVGQHELNAWLVAEGWALADRAVSQDYVALEDAARSARKGLWRGAFVPPWDWRHGRRLGPP